MSSCCPEYFSSGVMLILSNTTTTAQLNATFDETISWDFDVCLPRWFRVEGACRIPECVPPDTKCSPGGMAFVINILACNAEEVCRKLRSRNFVRRIKSISLIPYLPARNSDGTYTCDPISGVCPDQLCTTDVTPDPNYCIDCCDFLLDEDLLVRMGYVMAAQRGFEVDAVGTLVISSQTLYS